MATTDEQIDAAVPPNGIPSRVLTNVVLKDIRTNAELGANTASVVQRFSPSEGDVVSVGNGKSNVIVILEGDKALDSVVLQLPAGDDEREGQIVRVVSLIGVDDLSYGEAQVWGAPNQLFVSDGFALFNIGLNEWVLIR